MTNKNPFQLASEHFPEDFRAFCNGQLSVCLDRFGGMDAIRFMEVYEHDGNLFPEQCPMDFVTRHGNHLKDPFCSPAVFFGSRTRSGGFFHCAPEHPAVYPAACVSRKFEMNLGPSSLSVKIRNPKQCRGLLAIDPERYLFQKGEYPSKINQCASPLFCENRGEGYDPDKPFSDGNERVVITRQLPVCDARKQVLLFRIDRKYAFGERPLFVAVCCSEPVQAEIRDNRWILAAEKESAETVFAMGFAVFSPEKAEELARSAIKSHAQAIRAAGNPGRFPGMLSFESESLPSARRFSSVFPHYQSAAAVENATGLAIRAAQFKYGFFLLWDHIYPARDYLLMGMPEKTEKALRYVMHYPYADSSGWIPIQLIAAINEMMAFLPNSGIIRESNFYHRFFDLTCKWCDPETGFFAGPGCLAVDFPKEAGLDGLFYEAGINGMWYNACRVLENMAFMTGDTEFAERTGQTAARIKRNYARAFYDEKAGFLRTAMRRDGSYPEHELYLYTNTWGMDYLHGQYLFRAMLPALTRFQSEKLYHPMGHIFMPMENAFAGSCSVAQHMNQHLGHECACARAGNNVREVRRLMKGYLKYFDKFRNAIETFNYNFCPGDQLQRADWQTFSATAAMQGLVRGIGGLLWHRGGLGCIPAEDQDSVCIRNFHFRGHVIDFECSGKGMYPDSFRLNGKEIRGTMQIPGDILSVQGEMVQWKVRRGKKKPDRPTLIFAADAEVVDLRSTPKKLTFTLADTLHASIKIVSPGRTRFALNGKEIQAECVNGDNTYWLDRIFHAGDVVQVSLKSSEV